MGNSISLFTNAFKMIKEKKEMKLIDKSKLYKDTWNVDKIIHTTWVIITFRSITLKL